MREKENNLFLYSLITQATPTLWISEWKVPFMEIRDANFKGFPSLKLYVSYPAPYTNYFFSTI